MRRLVFPIILLSIAGCSEGLKPAETAEPAPSAPVEAPLPAAPEPVVVPADLPGLTATLTEMAPAAGLANGGSIDAVSSDTATNTVTVSGWVQVKSGELAPELKVYAPGAVSIGQISRVVRDDVSAALGDQDLLFSGFDLTIRTSPDQPLSELCISTTDSVYGETLLVVQPGAMPSCSVPPAQIQPD